MYHKLGICGAIDAQESKGIVLLCCSTKLSCAVICPVKQGKSNDSETEPDYCVVEFSIRDEIGSLATALEGFYVR